MITAEQRNDFLTLRKARDFGRPQTNDRIRIRYISAIHSINKTGATFLNLLNPNSDAAKRFYDNQRSYGYGLTRGLREAAALYLSNDSLMFDDETKICLYDLVSSGSDPETAILLLKRG